MSTPERILLVRLSHLGDVVHALPVFHALRAGFPDAAIAWAVQDEFAELVEPLAGLERVVRFRRRGGARAWNALRAALADFAADWAVDAQGNTKSALVALASGAARRTGYHPADWTERFAAGGLTDWAPRATPAGGNGVAHAMDRALSLARHVAPGAAPRFDPGLGAAERAAGRGLLTAWLGRDARDGVILSLSAPDDVRAWPAERLRELALELARTGRPVLVLSGPREASAGRALEAALAGTSVSHAVGQRGLRALAAAFSAAAERGFRLVASDSGPLHLAAACGLPVVCLSGPQDERRTGPWPVPAPRGSTHPGAPHRVVRSAQALACAPCLARRCGHPQGPVCMAGIDAGRVLAELA